MTEVAGRKILRHRSEEQLTEAEIRSALLSNFPLQGGLLFKAPSTTPKAGADLVLRASCIMPTFHHAQCIPPQLPCCLQGCVSGSISPLQGEKWYLQAAPSPPQPQWLGQGLVHNGGKCKNPYTSESAACSAPLNRKGV